MVKLVRLTTENNNNFNVNMDSTMTLGKNASVAVQNVTFESDFPTLSIGGNDRTVGFNWDVSPALPDEIYNGFLKVADYTSSNYELFFTDLEGALNDTLSVSGGFPGAGVGAFNNYMQFHVNPKAETKSIDFRVTPMIHPLLVTRAFDFQYEPENALSDYNGVTTLFSAVPALYNVAGPVDGGGEPPALTTPGIWLNTPTFASGDQDEVTNWGVVTAETGTSGATRDRFFYANPNVHWCRGSSVWWCRVHTLGDNTVAKNTNGFAIGLSYTPINLLGSDSTLPTSSQDFEIRCYRPQDNIEYIDPLSANTHQDGEVQPNTVLTPSTSNDIMMIRKDGNTIRGLYITQDAAAAITELFSYEIPIEDRNKALHPYGYVCGERDVAQMGQPSLTIDPWEIDDISPNPEDAYMAFLTPQVGDLYGYNGDIALDSGYNRSSAVIQASLPVLDQVIYNDNGPYPDLTVVKIPSEVLPFMGFVGNAFTAPPGSSVYKFLPKFNQEQANPTYAFVQFGFSIVANSVFVLANTDNFMVILDSNPVVSYDASRTQGLLANDKTASKIGKRANIIATIPVNNNTSGLVEYDANELIYIDLDNATEQTISNLRVRILDKTFRTVNTLGESVMTLLFKDN